MSRRAAIGVSGLLGLAAVAAPAALFLDPLRRRGDKAGAAETWTGLGAVSRFPEDGRPRAVIVTEDQTDAWLSRPGVAVGHALVRRTGPAEFTVHSGVCPHLGCSVAFDPAGDRFRCPCHRSSFALDGELTPNPDGAPNPAPRGLDPLEWRLRDGRLEVRWVRYLPGLPDRIPVS
ncbi:MAG: Rieske (2Fe-2S) protein [Deltaproteobacteria bacterium]|nr:Rieske (2Fe-2S) protein [Deltaproteobacteria bacterium]MCB9788679.1 Rieske (2Fe-2S) protein [Deltaproteobacteria bacterium]